ncbi:MAG: hypothetical protein VX460_05195 [Planctomycetota bacterium]|nr:hypothetical protein [Planctomycetota bacterium]
MRPASLPDQPARASLLAIALALAAATACRAPRGATAGPGDTADPPFVVEQPLTAAEVARNERFEDRRRTRFQGAAPVIGTPISASAPRN